MAKTKRKWLHCRLNFAGSEGVRFNFSFKCFCGRKLRQRDNEGVNDGKVGYYCRRHGLQVLVGP